MRKSWWRVGSRRRRVQHPACWRCCSSLLGRLPFISVLDAVGVAARGGVEVPRSACCRGRHIYSIKFSGRGRRPAELPLFHRLLAGGAAGCCSRRRASPSACSTSAHLNPVGTSARWPALALLVAFLGQRRTVAIDAWRIEAVPQSCRRDAAATARLSHRDHVASAGALWIAADFAGLPHTRDAFMVGVGIAPRRSFRAAAARGTADAAEEQRVIDWRTQAHWQRHAAGSSWFVGAVVCPS